MVTKLKYNYSEKDSDFLNIPASDFSWSSVLLSEVKENKNRLEASVFDLKVKSARQLLNNCSNPLVNFWSKDGLVKHAHYPGRFKRTYVNPNEGIPLFLPSQISSINPKPTKWISIKKEADLDILKAHRGELLINRSGTIGPVTIVSDTLNDKILSDDIIRVIPKNPLDLGYIYAFLRSEIGQVLLTTNSYGAVISHIEPEHLQSLLIPVPSPLIRLTIHNLIIDSFNDRDKSNQLIEEADELLYQELNLPNIYNLPSKYFIQDSEFQNFQIKLSNVRNRLDTSFHLPIIDSIINHISSKAKEVTRIDDKRISSKIILPGRFKRVYVEEGQGVIFFGGKTDT